MQTHNIVLLPMPETKPPLFSSFSILPYSWHGCSTIIVDLLTALNCHSSLWNKTTPALKYCPCDRMSILDICVRGGPSLMSILQTQQYHFVLIFLYLFCNSYNSTEYTNNVPHFNCFPSLFNLSFQIFCLILFKKSILLKIQFGCSY